MSHRVVTVFGGSGFLGRYLISQLAAEGYTVRAVVRDVQAAQFLKPIGAIGQVIPWPGNIIDPGSVAHALDGASMAINLVGILSPWGRQTFQAVHVDGAANIAKACAKQGVKRLIQVSALGADLASDSLYARTKAAGEAAVLEAYPEATIIRPSVIFGPEDGFFNKFAALSRITPVLPIIGVPVIPEVSLGGRYGIEINVYGDGGAKMQPVYVADVTRAMVNALKDNASRGKIYELGGPEVYSFKALMDLLAAVTGKKRFAMPVCYPVASIMGFFLEKLPYPMLTRDQVALLRCDNVISGDLPGLNDLGVQAQPAEAILPTYLHRYRNSSYEQVHNP